MPTFHTLLKCYKNYIIRSETERPTTEQREDKSSFQNDFGIQNLWNILFQKLTCFCGRVVSKIHLSTLILTCLWTSKRVLTKSLHQGQSKISTSFKFYEAHALSKLVVCIRLKWYWSQVFSLDLDRDLGRFSTMLCQSRCFPIDIHCNLVSTTVGIGIVVGQCKHTTRDSDILSDRRYNQSGQCW